MRYFVYFFPIFGGILFYFLTCEWATLIVLFTLLILKWKRIIIVIKTFRRDIRTIHIMSRLVSKTKKYEKANMSLVDAFRKQLSETPNKACYIFEEKIWTLQDVEDYSNKIANVFAAAGYNKGEVVALFMTNRPEYVCIWLGLSKLGIITALINTNLSGKSLAHCISAAGCKTIVFSEEHANVVIDVCSDLALYQLDGTPSVGDVNDLGVCLEQSQAKPPTVEARLGYMDKLLYIYTSGTTGLPKAAILPNSRYIMATMAMYCLLNLNDDDVIYNPLPLYHTNGGALGAGVALTCGITVVLKRKFSASAYISDCIKYNCTVGQYIGEICRYIMAVQPRSEDKSHKLHSMIGNGLRPALWDSFVQRFNIPNIIEVYGSTEGNVNIANLDNTVGAVGSLPQFLPQSFFPVAVIKIDPDTEFPIRDKNGLCIRCEPGETGMFVGLIKSNDPSRHFHGYINQEESKKKVITDVFSKGDAAFISGDLMVMDELGYIYFKDRTGDTFRWKGENVATSEVEAIISSLIGLRDCIVYGVQVGDLEGKAGMAAIVDPSGDIDMVSLGEKLDISLPNYARPLFLRILPSVELTGTFKLKKIQLQKQGFNAYNISDKIYYRDGGKYVLLTNVLYDDIIVKSLSI